MSSWIYEECSICRRLLWVGATSEVKGLGCACSDCAAEFIEANTQRAAILLDTREHEHAPTWRERIVRLEGLMGIDWSQPDGVKK